MKPTFYEFFAGGGMARQGLGAGWKCLFANDFDPKKAASYRANWGASDFVRRRGFSMMKNSDLLKEIE